MPGLEKWQGMQGRGRQRVPSSRTPSVSLSPVKRKRRIQTDGAGSSSQPGHAEESVERDEYWGRGESVERDEYWGRGDFDESY